ncbi:hypothetical protein PROFUN_02148 [Planoprotostelium fungivorum]|uniref:Protein kinase domain-containing protein n=1 Tax=Planoprotostelium fungivorum TaxID=1890364 RepID=A0A2P6NZ96_9EUKA|nr:hypothetical protein PROFUN_02148 [Planoprotostelium fungivorum]
MWISDRLSFAHLGDLRNRNIATQHNSASEEDMHAQEQQQRYQLSAVLGTGSYGQVFVALDSDTQQPVAIKVVGNQTNAHRIDNEIKANSIVSGVRGICPFRGHFRNNQETCLVFDRILGIDLFQLLESRNYRPLPELRVRKIMSRVAHALSECHRRGVAHRDIKLENIMIDDQDRGTIIDFGLASFIDSVDGKEMATRDLCGSMEYMAPEFVLQKSIEASKTDAWALGVTTFALLYGAFPYATEELGDVIENQCVDIPAKADGVRISEDMRRILSKLMTIDPARRAGVEILK